VIQCALLQGPCTVDPASVVSEREAGLLSPRAVPKRRDDFLRGRFIAKSLLASLSPPAALTDFVVLPDERGVPEPFDAAQRALPWSLSISHTAGYAAAAVVPLPARVGIDVERWLQQPEWIVRDYFTETEKQLLEAVGPDESVRAASGIWSAKEAVSKALGAGLRLATTSIAIREVHPGPRGAWRTLAIEWRQLEKGGVTPISAWVQELSDAAVAVAVIAPGGWDDPRPPCWRPI
jgi:phosphopantetheinyl transferase